MKKILKNITLLLFTSSLFLTSCTEHLEVDTYNNITGASYWKTSGDAEAYAYGIAKSYKNRLNGNIGYFQFSEGRTDMLKPGTGGPTLTGRAESHTQTALLGTGSWKNWYNTIHHCNLLLKNTPALDFENDADKNQILAMGYTYRALLYFDLVRIFGDVPIATDPTEGRPDVENYLARSTKQEVFTLIKSDIETALSLFPSEAIDNKNFVSKTAANALKAEVYMWTAKALNARGSANQTDLNTAISAIDNVLNSPSVSWDGDYNHIFQRSANSSSEYIFANYYSKDEGGNVFYRASIRPGFLPEELIGTFAHALVSEGHSNISYGDVLETLYDVENDLRYANNVVNIPDSADQVIIKFPGYTIDADNKRYWDNDIPLFRYSDMLLLKAEALNTLGESGNAIIILNQTRNRAGLENYAGATDQNTVEDEILDERARELAFENKVWWDLCRAHKVGQNVERFMENRGDDATNESLWNFYYWPISESMQLSNPNLVQSAGY